MEIQLIPQIKSSTNPMTMYICLLFSFVDYSTQMSKVKSIEKSWTIRLNWEDRINRKPDDQIYDRTTE